MTNTTRILIFIITALAALCFYLYTHQKEVVVNLVPVGNYVGGEVQRKEY